jgi:hypothetical protein
MVRDATPCAYPPWPSVTLKLKPSDPVKPGPGTYTKEPSGLRVRTPLAGWTMGAARSVSLSASVALTSTPGAAIDSAWSLGVE